MAVKRYKGAKAKADKLFSEIIRSIGYCENCGKETSNKRFCSRKCSTIFRHNTTIFGFSKQERLDKNPSWVGEKVKYRGLHSWVSRNWGKARICEHCFTTEAKIYDWSNKTGQMLRDRDNWQELCRSCHMKYDYANGMRGLNGSKKI